MAAVIADNQQVVATVGHHRRTNAVQLPYDGSVADISQVDWKMISLSSLPPSSIHATAAVTVSSLFESGSSCNIGGNAEHEHHTTSITPVVTSLPSQAALASLPLPSSLVASSISSSRKSNHRYLAHELSANC